MAMKINWEDKGLNEKGYNENGKKIIEINPKFYRPAEVKILLGDPSKAKKELGWEPKTNFDELVEMMVKSDLERLSGK